MHCRHSNSDVLDGWQPAGSASVAFHAENLPSGLYTCVLESSGATLCRVMHLLK